MAVSKKGDVNQISTYGPISTSICCKNTSFIAAYLPIINRYISH